MTQQDVTVAQACYNAGFRDDALRTIVAIAAAESNCDPDAPPTDTREAAANGTLPAGTQAEYSVGVFRFNLLAHPEMTEDEARDIDASAVWAYRTFRLSGFNPWSTYSYEWDTQNDRLVYVGDGEGAYHNYITRAETAIAQIATDGGLGLDVQPDGSVAVVATPGSADGTQPLPLPDGILDIAAQCQRAFEGMTANLTEDEGTAEQRAAAYNVPRALLAFRKLFDPDAS